MRITEVSITNPVLRRTPWKAGPVTEAKGSVLVSLTDFQIDGYRDLLRVVRTALEIQRGWGGREGSLGLALWVQPLRRRLGSLSAWEGEADYHRWVPEHMTVVRRHRGHMQNIHLLGHVARGPV
jgi:hypothetical protein